MTVTRARIELANLQLRRLTLYPVELPGRCDNDVILTNRRCPVPGKKKFGDEEEPDRDHCPKCGVKLTQGEKDSERCRNGHALP